MVETLFIGNLRPIRRLVAANVLCRAIGITGIPKTPRSDSRKRLEMSSIRFVRLEQILLLVRARSQEGPYSVQDRNRGRSD